jgi:hypothetical protein
MASRPALKGVGLLLAGLVGYGLVALAWMRWQPTDEPFWRDYGSTTTQELASPEARYQARLAVRARSELALLGGEHEKIPVVTISDRKRRTAETWALLSAPGELRLSWAKDGRLVVGDGAAFRLAFNLDPAR